ncbi:hypothetical protein FTM89_03365 [Chlamydia trachomatis]|jgi:hypothetical protein|uniref:Uncharacterized protein TC_0634 n=2 Tax=Chlamydia muridarum TaxID=83560 RepID=Y634_CHLMU|nr:hypothetical protein [Chlamydia muridarum]Q9PK39.1 RecName: Full=Uncharacterized protein TC_0634; Flags: Precursor [Chlamydia muridarum str. Nigg]UFT44022.1 hypothetical protein FTN72_03380 [Chlamydia trachomatis]AAF39463.1 conserved hypothetical protein [Chlamydia muridarum str. Nigg]AHH23020.1 hypothetical protein TAC_03330 [Chlamydia muridarum str. Nigg3 CMUT3-5]AHH23945.1 hypothetical protein Y015_03330 [Chlamydia muridarum str. Nigg CM972]AID38152.1 hypothetical protein BB17_03380 [Ch
MRVVKRIAVACYLGITIFSGIAFGYEGSFPSSSLEQNPSGVAIHNRVLFKIDEDTVVTTLDVIHKLNILFYSTCPQLVDSVSARSQYYSAMWPVVLESVINEFLMAADAKEKKIFIDPTSVNQEIEAMFGRDLSPFAKFFDMTPGDIFNVVHRVLVAQRIEGMMVRSRVMLKVTPGMVRDRYQKLVEDASQVSQWTYRVLTIKAGSELLANKIAGKVQERLNEGDSWDKERLAAMVLSQGGQLICSDEFIREDAQLSAAHKKALEEINFPEERCGKALEHASGLKLFVLFDCSTKTLEPLEKMEAQIKQRLMMELAEEEEANYKNKLRARYGFDPSIITQLLSEDAPQLFSLL